MTLQLSPDRERRLRAQVDAGRFASLDAALEEAVDRLLDADPRSELNRLVQEGVDDIANGDVIDGEEAFRQLRAESARRRALAP